MDLILSSFMPHLAGLRVEHLAASADHVAVTLRTSTSAAPCPLCQQPSGKVHSQYTRRVADLPWSGVIVVLHVHVRKFVCHNETCVRRIFCERMPALVPVYGRRTVHLQAWLRHVGFALGGQPGARLSRACSMGAGRTSLLQLVRRTPLPALPTPRVLGVDDWSWRRGRTYGTLLVDLERHCPVDLLPTRTADAFAQWLREHPGVEIISRDRAGAYADGARRGAPQAMQVADRFHLVRNMGEAVEQIVGRRHGSLRAAQHVEEPLPAPPAGSPVCPPSLPAPSVRTRDQQRKQDRRTRRQERFAEVRALHADGHSQRVIAQTLGISRHVVQRFVQADDFPERKERAARMPLCAPYEPYVRGRWDAGCQEAATLWREIRALGYTGSPSGLRQYLRRWRTEPGRPGPRAQRFVSPRPPAPPKRRTFSVRQATWVLLRDPAELDEEERAFLSRLCALCPAIATTLSLAHVFLRLFRTRDHAALEPWLEQAETSMLPELGALAAGLRTDRAAVDAALQTEWSNGQLEGGVNKLKTLKRQMYGRAGFTLLRQRLLYHQKAA